jgi:3-hydroxyisobutyrate dehydrogenase-like beta-hydroxyacid dehydrogenase
MKIAFLGLGIMGSRMAANLVAADFEVTVWNRTAAIAEEFAVAQPKARVAATPREAADGAELVITMVVDGAQVRELLLAEDHGAAAGAAPDTLFVDCSTIGPEQAREVGAALGDRGFRFIDAPVTGSAPRAADATLTFMVGGARSDYEFVLPALERMGKVIVHAGVTGQGQTVKVINNAVAAVNATTLAQALVLGSQAGADLTALLEVMGAGSGGSTMLTLKGQPMLDHDFTTLFKLDHMLKDVRLCLQAAADAGADFPFAAETEQVLARASQRGLGDQDFAALIEPLEVDAGVRIQGP